MTGYCSNCHKVWILEERQGICQWCSREAICLTTLTKPRQLKFSRSRRRKQVDNGNNGYDQLPEPYLTYYKVAMRFAHKALLDEREDLLHDILTGLARTGQLKASRGDEFTQIAQIRTAEHIKDHYWYRHYSYYNGLDCQHCSKVQRAKCRYNWGHSDWAFADCHRAVQLESLNQPIIDSEGNTTELAELIADDKALDLADWTNINTFIRGCPQRLIDIAEKIREGTPLASAEMKYLCKWRKRQQKRLV